MKKLFFPILLLTAALGVPLANGQDASDLAKLFKKVSKYITVLNDTKDMNNILAYRMGWNGKSPNTIGVQFSNLGYGEKKLKFAVKDVTSKKNVVLDTAHNSPFGTETLKGSSTGTIWSGTVDNINDKFSLRVWIGDGDEIDKEPLSLKDVK